MITTESPLDADLVILGGGCAGLSLATRLANRGGSPKVVVIEPRTHYSEDRTWCGWRTSPHPYSDCVAATWPDWRVICGKRTIERGSRSQPYEMIPASRFYEHSLEAIRSTPTVCMAAGTSAETVSEDSCGVLTRLSNGRTLRSHWVVDTRPQRQTSVYPALWQNFVGYEVTANAQWTEQLGTTPVLMDFQPCGASAVQFIYLLPLGCNRFLFEWTRFSAICDETDEIEEALKGWLQRRGCSAAMIGRRESGSLPMAVTPPPLSRESRIIRAGTLGGSMRASTGYAFHAIQRWADAATESLSAGGPPVAPTRNARLNFLDEVFLTAIQDRSTGGESIFLDLFERTDADRLVRFLSGIPRPADILSVMVGLPWLPFSKAALKTLRRTREKR